MDKERPPHCTESSHAKQSRPSSQLQEHVLTHTYCLVAGFSAPSKNKHRCAHVPNQTKTHHHARSYTEFSDTPPCHRDNHPSSKNTRGNIHAMIQNGYRLGALCCLSPFSSPSCWASCLIAHYAHLERDYVHDRCRQFFLSPFSASARIALSFSQL